MKRRNGFTLVELLAVMIILGLLIVLVIPAYTSVYSGIKRNNYQNKLIELSTAAKKYGSKIKDEIKYAYDKDKTCYDIKPSLLIEKGYLMSDFDNKPGFIDPSDQTEMDGDIHICYCKSTFDIEAYYVEDLIIDENKKINYSYHEEDILLYDKVLYRCIKTYNPMAYDKDDDTRKLNKTKNASIVTKNGKKSITVGKETYFVQVEC